MKKRAAQVGHIHDILLARQMLYHQAIEATQRLGLIEAI